MRALALDIGGANTKKLLAEFRDGEAILKSEIHYFPIWKKKKKLRQFLRELQEEADCVAITFTAELSDIFESKAQGVRYLAAICEEVFRNPLYLSIDKKLMRYEQIQEPLKLVAANFTASVYYLEKKFGSGILLDVGSTTTDVVPFKQGEILYGKTDLQRLQRNQLVYTGALRTPLNCISNAVPFRGQPTRVASEYFAIAADVYTILGLIKDYKCDTPDGRAKDMRSCMQRVARLLCADLEDIGEEAVIEICEHMRSRQAEQIASALAQVAREHSLSVAYVCGAGSFLGKEACRLAGMEVADLASVTPAHDNLPCLGLAHMVQDFKL